MGIKRDDDFAERRKDLANLSDEELKQKFWNLTEKIVDPLLEQAKTHTSPSIERSVLLRMGFDSLAAKAIADKVYEAELLGKGAGHVVIKLAEKEEISYQKAGQAIANGEYELKTLRSLFERGEQR